MKEKLKKIFSWIIGVFFILSFFQYFKEALVPSFFIGITGLLLLPPVNEKYKEKFSSKDDRYNFAKIVFIITSFFIFTSNLGNNTTQNISNTSTVSKNMYNDTGIVTQSLIQEPLNNKSENDIQNNIENNESENKDTLKTGAIEDKKEEKKNEVQNADSHYEGNYLNGKKNGQGKYTWDNGSVYEGVWTDDKLTGIGVLYTVSDGRYEGYFVDGKKSGYGKYFFPNGDLYEGNWEDDKMSGKGKYKFMNGDEYEGSFSNNAFNGTGTYKFKNGKTYSGTWKNNEYSK